MSSRCSLLNLEAEVEFPKRVYSSWDEATGDPNLDLGKPWFVIPNPTTSVPPAPLVGGWPEGWTEVGYTVDEES